MSRLATQPPSDPSGTQIDLMTPNDKWFQTAIVKADTQGVIGLYGTTDNKYYFYTKFQTVDDISASGV